MTVFRRIWATALLAVALVPLGTAHAASSGCGTTITASTTLRGDLAGCAGDGLVVGADGITLDLSRHTIAGAGTAGSAGIRLAGHRGVTIRGGTVQGFDTGVALAGADGNRVSGLTVRGNAGRGIDAVGGSDGNVFDGVVATANGSSGIALTESDRNDVRGATASGNGVTGILVLTGTANRVERSTVAGNVHNGIVVVEGSTGNVVAGDNISGGEAGILLDGADRNTLTLNRLARNGDAIVLGGDANTVAGNIVTDPAGCADGCAGDGILVPAGAGNLLTANLVHGAAADGIAVTADATGTRIELNAVDGSGHDGFLIQSAASALARNLAVHNAAWGIEAVPGVTDRGGNRAQRNGAGGCLNLRC
jgi:large repetitive protein